MLADMGVVIPEVGVVIGEVALLENGPLPFAPLVGGLLNIGPVVDPHLIAFGAPGFDEGGPPSAGNDSWDCVSRTGAFGFA